jgi:FtsH-binding integral membrane protein
LAVITIDLVRSQRTRAVLLPLRVFMVLTLVVVGVVMVSPDPVVRSVLARFSTGADTDLRGHVQTRLDALGIWVTDPKTFLFGVGFSNYSLYGSGIHSHSPYTTVLGERGLVGSLPFWAFYFGVSVWAGRRAVLWRKLDPDRFSMLLGIFAATVGVLFGSIFYEYIHRNVVWILFALAAGTIRTTGWEAKNALRDGPRSQEE